MNIVILDTNCCNLLSIKLAILKLGYHPIITSDPEIIFNANKLFLPGVGSASGIMKQLYKKNMIDVIKNITCHTLGICLGMQALSIFSTESNGTKMLGVINSGVSLLRTHKVSLPHTGWNKVMFEKMHPLFKNIDSGSWFYFIHSYAFSLNKYTIATSYYDTLFSSAIQKNNFFGVQFHPEKSGLIGSRLLLNFLEM